MQAIYDLNKLAHSLEQLLRDKFAADKGTDQREPTAEAAPSANPIVYLIEKTMDTQISILSCGKIIDREIIKKLEGEN